MPHPLHATALLLGLSLLLGPPARGEDRYEQKPSHGLSWGNSRITAVADDFLFEETTEVNRIRWWGTYALADAGDPPRDQFTIRIFSDNAGTPDRLLLQHRVPDPNRSLTGDFADVWRSYQYEYSADLPAPFTARAGQRYWISIQNDPLEERSSLPTLSANQWSWVFGDPSRHFGVAAALIKKTPPGR